MFNRRTFLSLLATGLVTPRMSYAQQTSQKVGLYANVGADLTHYDVDVAGAELIKRETVTLPAGVQYAWPHVSRRYLYVASSSSAPGYGTQGTEHHVSALAIDPASGALTRHGEPIRLPARPIHISTDIPSENILVAFNNPSAVRVYRINNDATPGEEVKQPEPIDAGVFAHQVRVLDRPRIAAHPDAPRQMDHLHAIAAGRRSRLADIVEAGEPGLPDRPALGMPHDMAGEFLLARVAAVGVERNRPARRGAKAARPRRIAVARMAEIDRRPRHPAADADRHQDRPDPVIAKPVRPALLVEHHVAGAEPRLDDLVVPHPADRQDAVEHEKMLDDLMRMAGGVFADRLVDEGERERAGLQRVRVVDLGRAAGADIAHLRPRQFGKPLAPGKRIPVEALVGMPPDRAAHRAREVERIAVRGQCHDKPPPAPGRAAAPAGRDVPQNMARRTRFPNTAADRVRAINDCAPTTGCTANRPAPDTTGRHQVKNRLQVERRALFPTRPGPARLTLFRRLLLEICRHADIRISSMRH
jgi:Lactonase, 7-bladed beta-propeller